MVVICGVGGGRLVDMCVFVCLTLSFLFLPEIKQARVSSINGRDREPGE